MTFCHFRRHASDARLGRQVAARDEVEGWLEVLLTAEQAAEDRAATLLCRTDSRTHCRCATAHHHY